MNSDQITTTVNHLVTAALAALTLLGIVDAATATQLVTVFGEALTASMALLTAVGTILSIVTAIWRRSHPAQMDAGARAIAAGADPTPVIVALEAKGAVVDTTMLPAS